MRLENISIENFRSYKEKTSIKIDQLTVFVGKNDIGKSTILEALDIFFNENKGVIKIDSDDINKEGLREGKADIIISASFSDIPESITIDSTNPTNLKDEFLLNKDGHLEIIKKYPSAGKEKIFIKANHPTNKNCSDLLNKKITELRSSIPSGAHCKDQTKSAEIRKSIWEYYKNDLRLDEIEIDISKMEEKSIWGQLKNHLPTYALFQSDRKNSENDSEIQDPMKLAVQEILKNPEITTHLDEVAKKVEETLKLVAENTLKKLNEMNPEVASSLTPVIPNQSNLKWIDVFKNVSITGDESIPINKRGSGVKRLILLNFFRAEVERRSIESTTGDIIYAIEEPETSQHPNHQSKLIEAFKELSKSRNTLVLLTTHSPPIVKMLDFSNLRLIKNDIKKEITLINPGELPYPSLNEVNFSAFNEACEEYHNELYGYIESEGRLSDYQLSKVKITYIKKNNKNSKTATIQITKSEYIRHQIHHPENTANQRFNKNELLSSIEEMRNFINTEIK